ncbi:hypothetical protein Hanom_Chr14g01309111 [Helianthus anomalus]
MGSGQNGSIKKRVVLVRVETGSGWNGFGSGWVRVRTGRVGSGGLNFFIFYFKVTVHVEHHACSYGFMNDYY